MQILLRYSKSDHHSDVTGL